MRRFVATTIMIVLLIIMLPFALICSSLNGKYMTLENLSSRIFDKLYNLSKKLGKWAGVEYDM